MFNTHTHRLAALLLAAAAMALLAWALPATAQPVYRCTVDGKITLQQTPCTAGEGQRLEVRPANVVEGNPAGNASLRAEAARAAAVRSNMARGQLSTGMTERELVQMLGQPTVVNTDYVAGKVRKQWVYRYADGSARYVYTTDGLTDALQERPGTGAPHVGHREPQPCYSEREIWNASVSAGGTKFTDAELRERRAAVQRMRECRR